MFTHYTVIAVRRYLVPGAIATPAMIAVFGICCEGRSRRHVNQFTLDNGAGGDRSFILGDRSS
ncbi:MAG: hypothetical protein ACM65L_27410 [Microcoleus sp.]